MGWRKAKKRNLCWGGMAKRRESLLFGIEGIWQKKKKKKEGKEEEGSSGEFGVLGKMKRKDSFLKKRPKRKERKQEGGESTGDLGGPFEICQEESSLCSKGKEREDKREREEGSHKKGRKRRKKNLGDFCSLPYDGFSPHYPNPPMTK